MTLFGLPLDLGLNASEIIECVEKGNFLLTYLNPYSYAVAKTDSEYRDRLEEFDFVVCDGIGVQVAAKSVFGISTPILTLDYNGIAKDYLAASAAQGLCLYLVGAKQEIVRAAAARLEKEYPGFLCVKWFDGYGKSPERAREEILATGSGMVLVGMGMGRQEAFLLDLKDSGWRGVGFCIGGFFDKLANPDLEYQAWAEKTRLRFLGRLIREPRRLSRRYFIDYQEFLKLYFKFLFKGR